MEKNRERSPFEKLSTKKVSAGRFTVIQDEVRINGHVQPYDFLEVRPGVCVLPLIDDRVIVQKQYRYPVKQWQWELPGGFIDDGETPEKAAERELTEETGYLLESLHSLGGFYPSFGSTNEIIYLFWAECNNRKEAQREPGELIVTEEMSMDEFTRLIASGEFMHGAGLAAFVRYIL